LAGATEGADAEVHHLDDPKEHVDNVKHSLGLGFAHLVLRAPDPNRKVLDRGAVDVDAGVHVALFRISERTSASRAMSGNRRLSEK
jgi:hypothetical protein